MTFDEKLEAWNARGPRPEKPPRFHAWRPPQMSPEKFTAYIQNVAAAQKQKSATRVLLGHGGSK
jgi:hypothetical protein